MENFKKNSWMIALIAGIIAVVSLITPIVGTDDGVVWGGYVAYESDSNLWYGELTYGFYLPIILSVSATLLLQYSLLSRKGKEFKWVWLSYLLPGIAMVLFSIFFWIDVSNFKNLTIGFTSIGSFIAGILAIAAGIFEKTKSRT